MSKVGLAASVVSTREGDENQIFDDFLRKPVKSEILMDSMCKFIKCEIRDIQYVSEESYDFTEVSIGKYPELQKLLKRAKSEGDMDLIQEFAHKVEIVAKENNLGELKTLSTQILSAVESFDIGECEILLSKFKD